MTRVRGAARSVRPELGRVRAARRSSRSRMTLEFCLLRCTAGALTRSTLVHDDARSAWPVAGCTTSSAAASTATRRTSAGSSRTSRRCSTTTRRCVRLYVHAWQVTGNARYRTRRRLRPATYLLRELRMPEGGFFSSQDADSEGVGGPVLRLVVGRALSSVGAMAVATAFGATPGRELGGDQRAVRHCRPRRWRDELELEPDELAARPRGGEADGCPSSARDGSTPRPTTRCSRPGTGWRSRAPSPRPGGRSATAGTWRPRSGRPSLVLDAPAGRLRAAPALVARRACGAARVRRRPRGDGGCVPGSCTRRPSSSGGSSSARVAGGRARFGLFHDEGRGGFFPARDGTRRRSSSGQKDLSDNAVPERQPASAECPAAPRPPDGRGLVRGGGRGALRLVRDAMAGAPSGFGHALGALEARTCPPVKEVARPSATPASEETLALVAEVTTNRFLPNHVLAVSSPGDERPMSRGRAPSGPPAEGRARHGLRARALRVPAPVTIRAAAGAGRRNGRVRVGSPERDRPPGAPVPRGPGPGPARWSARW